MNEAMDLLIDNSLFTLCIIFFIGIIADKIAVKLKLPEVVIFMIFGMILGSPGLNIINISDSSLINQLVLIFGAAYIIYCGGKDIKFKELNQVKITVSLLASVGVIISTAVVAFGAKLLFNLDDVTSLLLGAVIASTDPAALIPVFKKLTVKKNLKITVISESAFNDAVGTVLVITILNVITEGTFDPSSTALLLARMIVIGVCVGFTVGYVLSFFIGGDKRVLSDYSAIIGLISAMSAYAIADFLGGSGFMSAFVAGLVCGNKKTFGLWVPEPSYIAQSHFKETIESIFKMSIFILLGSHVDFGLLFAHFWGSLAIILILIFIARPLSIFVCTLNDPANKWTLKEKLFMCYVRETGVIPAAMSSVIVAMRIPGYEIIASVIVMAIIITIGIQSSTTVLVAKKLGLQQ